MSISLVRRRLGPAFFAVLAIVALGVSAVRPHSVDQLRAGTMDLAAPVLGAVNRPIQEAALFVRGVTGLAALQEENTRLYQENMKLREWYQAATKLQAENKSLHDLLNVSLSPKTTFVSTRVLADPGNTFAKSLLVSAGQADGVEKGQAVVSGSGIVGRIVEVGQDTARVLLLTDINSRVPVMIEGSGEHAILAGQNSPTPQLIHLPEDHQVVPGQRVVTSGMGGIYAQGLPVGKVIAGPDKKPRVMLFTDYHRLLYVRVAQNASPNVLNPALD